MSLTLILDKEMPALQPKLSEARNDLESNQMFNERISEKNY
jgi:hypothetical protein